MQINDLQGTSNVHLMVTFDQNTLSECSRNLITAKRGSCDMCSLVHRVILLLLKRSKTASSKGVEEVPLTAMLVWPFTLVRTPFIFVVGGPTSMVLWVYASSHS